MAAEAETARCAAPFCGLVADVAEDELQLSARLQPPGVERDRPGAAATDERGLPARSARSPRS